MDRTELARARQTLRRAETALRAARLAVTVEQVAALEAIRAAASDPRPGPTLGELARALGVTPAVVTGMVDRLERQLDALRAAVERAEAHMDEMAHCQEAGVVSGEVSDAAASDELWRQWAEEVG
jgi:DNA-binding MarR family transcriptional regulator